MGGIGLRAMLLEHPSEVFQHRRLIFDGENAVAAQCVYSDMLGIEAHQRARAENVLFILRELHGKARSLAAAFAGRTHSASMHLYQLFDDGET